MQAHLLASSGYVYHQALEFARPHFHARGLCGIAVFEIQGKMLALQIRVMGANNVFGGVVVGGDSAVRMPTSYTMLKARPPKSARKLR